MTFNIPVVTDLTDTSVIDDSPIFKNDVRRNFPAQLKVQHNGKIYKNYGSTIQVPAYDAGATYVLGDVAFKDGVIQIVVQANSFEVPKQPEDYATHDSSFVSSEWTSRYLRLADTWYSGGIPYSNFGLQDGFAEVLRVSYGTGYVYRYRSYAAEFNLASRPDVIYEVLADTIEKDAYVSNYEPSSYLANTIIVRPNGVFMRTNVDTPVEYTLSSSVVWKTVTSPEDMGFLYYSLVKPMQVLDDKQYTTAREHGDQNWKIHTNSIFDSVNIGKTRGDYITVVFKDSGGKEIDSVSKNITGSSNYNTEIIYASSKVGDLPVDFNVFLGGSFYQSNSGTVVFNETADDAYDLSVTDPTSVGVSPIVISDITEKIVSTDMILYSFNAVINSGVAIISQINTGGDFPASVVHTVVDGLNTITLPMLGDESNLGVHYDGTTLFDISITNIKLERLDIDRPGGYAEISIIGQDTEVGMLMLSESTDVGATNLKFSHDIKSFDRTEVDKVSGFVDYVEGNRVVDHKCSFDIEMTAYDDLVTLNKKLSQKLIAMDGSDMIHNEAADGVGMFDSTKIIGRIRSMRMQTDVEDGDMRKIIPVSCEIREIV